MQALTRLLILTSLVVVLSGCSQSTVYFVVNCTKISISAKLEGANEFLVPAGKTVKLLAYKPEYLEVFANGASQKVYDRDINEDPRIVVVSGPPLHLNAEVLLPNSR